MGKQVFNETTFDGVKFRETDDQLLCGKCGHPTFDILPVEFEDYENGYVGVCQKCGAVTTISKTD